MNVKLPIRSFVNSIQFCPYEDVLGIGHSRGMSSALIPGSGESTFDSKVPNPYSGNKNIADWNVRSLLEKIPFDMINLDPTVIGTTGERKDDFKYENNVELDDKLKSKLESLGITQKVERKKITSREELTKHLEEKHQKMKENQIGKEWWSKKGTNALDRFASGKQLRERNDDDEEEESEQEESEQIVDQNVQLPTVKENEDKESSDESEDDSEDENLKKKNPLYGNMSDSDSDEEEGDSENEESKSEGKKRNHGQLYDYETESDDEKEVIDQEIEQKKQIPLKPKFKNYKKQKK